MDYGLDCRTRENAPKSHRRGNEIEGRILQELVTVGCSTEQGIARTIRLYKDRFLEHHVGLLI